MRRRSHCQSSVRVGTSCVSVSRNDLLNKVPTETKLRVMKSIIASELRTKVRTSLFVEDASEKGHLSIKLM